MMSLDEPACLCVGTEVSAKYRGAFCEAKVKRVVKTVKVKVNLKDGGSVISPDDDLRGGSLRLGATVEVRHPESGQYLEGTITKITDASMYTVVFDDGDENTLRRTQLCLKGEKHFVKTDTLDELPLTHPEHFGTPVMKGGSRKCRRSPASGAMSDDTDSDAESSEDEELPSRRYSHRLEILIGRVLLMEQEDRKKTNLVPVLVVVPGADTSTMLKTREHLLVKSFKDSKFYPLIRKGAKDFTREFAMKNEDKALKNAYEKALLYFDAKELPQPWDREELLGLDSDEEDQDESSDDEPSEEKDRFVAQLYKFMDDRATPINKGPSVGARDLNLYRLFRIVQNLGGYNKVTNQMKWRLVYSKMGLPPSSVASNQIKTAYKKYLHAFEDFYRKLGSSMGTISRPVRSPRSHGPSGGGRSIISFRERERDSVPKSPIRHRKKEEADETASTTSATPSKAESEKPEIKTRSKVEEMKSESRDPSDTESDSPRKRTRGSVHEQTPKAAKEEAKRETRPQRPNSREDKKPVVKEEKPKDDDTTSEKDVWEEGRLPQRRRARKKRFGEEDDEEEQESVKSERLKPKEKEKPVKVETKPPEPASSSEESEMEEDGQKNEEGEKRSILPKDVTVEYPEGSRLKVKYGKGKNAKVYDAKVVEAQFEGGAMQYKVHYAGWNIRYDEWVRKDRIVCVIDKGKPSVPTNGPHKPTCHQPKKKKVPTATLR